MSLTPRKITVYFRGPLPSGNEFGGVTKSSPRNLEGKPFNTEYFLLIKHQGTPNSQWSHLSRDTPFNQWVMARTGRMDYVYGITEARYQELMGVWDALIGTAKAGLTWEKEEYNITWRDDAL